MYGAHHGTATTRLAIVGTAWKGTALRTMRTIPQTTAGVDFDSLSYPRVAASGDHGSGRGGRDDGHGRTHDRALRHTGDQPRNHPAGHG